MPDDFETFWKLARPRRASPRPEPPRENSSSLLREAYARGQGQGPTLGPDIERQVLEAVRELRARGVTIDQDVADHLRVSLLMEIEESTRSAPDPDPSPLDADQPFLNPQAEVARMHYQVSENASWYLSQGIVVSRSILESLYRANGGLRMDFTQARADEERRQRESAQADLVEQAQIQARLSPFMRERLNADIGEVRDFQERNFPIAHQGELEPPRPLPGQFSAQLRSSALLNRIANAHPISRNTETLLRLVRLFDELGVSCVVVNRQTGNPEVELQFSLFRDTPECPTSIGSHVDSDGVVHLRLGYRKPTTQ